MQAIGKKLAQLSCCLELSNRIELLNALVNAFDKLHIVRDEKSWYSGSKYSQCTSGSRAFGTSRFPSTKVGSKIFRRVIGDLRVAPGFDLALHRFKVPLDAVQSTESVPTKLKLLVSFASNRGEHARDDVSNFWIRRFSIVRGHCSGVRANAQQIVGVLNGPPFSLLLEPERGGAPILTLVAILL
jgi:hypothetical protein